MAYEVKIIDENALKNAHPELFTVNTRALVRILKAAKVLNQKVPGAELVQVDPAVAAKVEAQLATVDALVGTPVDEDVPAMFQRTVA